MIQTCSEENGLKEFSTLKDAIIESTKDTTIWKISFSIASGERVRLVKTTADEWIYEPILIPDDLK